MEATKTGFACDNPTHKNVDIIATQNLNLFNFTCSKFSVQQLKLLKRKECPLFGQVLFKLFGSNSISCCFTGIAIFFAITTNESRAVSGAKSVVDNGRVVTIGCVVVFTSK